MKPEAVSRPVRFASSEGVVRPLRVPYADDATLALALGAGHAQAAAAAWDRFSPLVRGLLWQVLGPSADVDDLMQEVFMTLFRRAKDLRDPGALGSFVTGICVRTARTELRRRRVWRWLMLSPDGSMPDVAGPDVDHEGREALASVYAILERLDADSRLAFVLRHAQGLDLPEIAKALDCSLATAKRRLAKGVERVLFHARKDPALLERVMSIAALAPEVAR